MLYLVIAMVLAGAGVAAALVLHAQREEQRRRAELAEVKLTAATRELGVQKRYVEEREGQAIENGRRDADQIALLTAEVTSLRDALAAASSPADVRGRLNTMGGS